MQAKHQKYALYLEDRNIPYIYREVFIEYVDMLTGQRKKHYIDFVLLTEPPVWVEVVKDLKPTDPRVYASRRAEEAGITYRALTEQESEFVYAP